MNGTARARSYEPSGPARWLARAFDGVTLRTVAFLLIVAMAYAMTKGPVNYLIVWFVDGGSWYGSFVLKTALSHMATAAVVFVAVVPVLNLGPRDGWRRVAALATAILLGTLVAMGVLVPLMEWTAPDPRDHGGYLQNLRFHGPSFIVLTAMLVAVAAFYQRTHANIQSAHEAELERTELERQMTQARIQVLQAQIEPHFLFNTLANVRRLYETDRDAGHRMLDNLMRYFEVALPQMRAGDSTLAHEIALIESYLNVQQIRFGRRLAFSIDVAEALECAEVPPMMLLTLVENALKHGIAPLPEGGSIRIVAEAVGDSLLLSVADTGRGLTGTTGAGTGLANIRARLSAAYGNAANLKLAGNAPRGITAQICLPMPASLARSG